MTDKKQITQTTAWKDIKCHTGNTTIYQEPNGGKLMIGGWSNGADFDWNTHVIDLTGLEHKYWDMPIAYDDASKDFLPFLMQAYKGWLSLPFPDYGTPKGMSTKEQWVGITEVIHGLLRQGTDVLVACHGGHGRSGLFCAIVGYLLNIASDTTWASPVEKIRKIHCQEAVETYAQEKYVYDILGLRIQVKHVYGDDVWFQGRGDYTGYGSYGVDGQGYYTGSTFKNCPICNTQSLYVDEYGMCMTCRKSFEDKAPVRADLSLKDIEHAGLIEHHCQNERCMGIWKAEKCGHVVHDQIIYEGLCEACFNRQEADNQYAEQNMPAEQEDLCTICGNGGIAASRYGVCYECASKLVVNKLVDDVHNSITDPYRYIPHKCTDDVMCVGIVRADVCQHVVHNLEVEDGLCPDCYDKKNGAKEAK